MYRHVWLMVLAAAVVTGSLLQSAFAQIEVKQNGDVILGTAGGPSVSNVTVNGNLSALGGNMILGTGPSSNTLINGSLTAPVLNAANTAITGNVSLGTPGTSATAVTTVYGRLNAPYLSAPSIVISGNVWLGEYGASPASTVTVYGNLNAASLVAATTTVQGSLTVVGGLNAPTLSAPKTTITGDAVVLGGAKVSGTLTVTNTTLATKLLYAMASSQGTTGDSYVDMTGLTFVLPAQTNNTNRAIITLNVPSPVAHGDNYPGATFRILQDGADLDPIAIFTSSSKQPDMGNTGRSPTTLTVAVDLKAGPSTIKAQWAGIRGSSVVIDSPATLSAVIGQKEP
jgi:mannose-binding lectin